MCGFFVENFFIRQPQMTKYGIINMYNMNNKSRNRIKCREKPIGSEVKVTVYIDVLFAENIAINFLILSATSYISRIKTSVIALLGGACIGATYVVAILLPDMEVYYGVLAKLVLSFVMIAVSFWPEKIKDFLKLLLYFYLVSFAFGGVVLGSFYFLNSKEGMIENGIYGISGFTLRNIMISIVIGYIIVRIAWDTIRAKAIKAEITVELCIELMQNKVWINALIDTGNSLKDPISELPVIVVEFRAIKAIIPKEIIKVFEEKEQDDLVRVTNAVAEAGWEKRFRVIPFTSLGTENGILVGFKPDRIEMKMHEGTKSCEDVILGIYNNKLSKDESYEALLSLEMAQ